MNSTEKIAKTCVCVAALGFLLIAPGRAAAQWETHSNNINSTNSGNVGIGTTAPGAKLDVKDTNNFQVNPNQSGTGEFSTSVLINSAGAGLTLLPDGNGAVGPKLFLGYRDTATPMWRSALEIANTAGFGNLLLMKSGGNVGIGTSSPSQKFQVIGGAGFFNSTSGVSINGGLTTGVADIYSDYLSGPEPKLHLATFSKKSTASGITIDTSGNVGIGIASPTVALDILGSINVSGNINAKYQDVAEWVPASHALPAGTVVTLDPTKSNHVEASTHAYDTRVAGVVSAQPGITLGEAGDSKVLVATTGRVKVMVDASSGSIAVGDLLVTSDIEGVAKKSEPLLLGGVPIHRPGTLIGKALEPLARGTGEILVLLSLQ